MTAYFLDSSAAVKLYVAEIGASWIRNLVDPAHGHSFHAVRLAEVEVNAALYRRARVATLSLANANAAAAQVRLDFTNRFVVADVTPDMIDLAVEIARQHGLRGAPRSGSESWRLRPGCDGPA